MAKNILALSGMNNYLKYLYKRKLIIFYQFWEKREMMVKLSVFLCCCKFFRTIPGPAKIKLTLIFKQSYIG